MNHEMGPMGATAEQLQEITKVVVEKFVSGSEVEKFMAEGEISDTDIVSERLMFVIDGKQCIVEIESSRSDFMEALQSGIVQKLQEKNISTTADITAMTSDFMITDPTELIDGLPKGKQHSMRTLI